MIKKHWFDLILVLLGVFALISFGYALNDKPAQTVTQYKDWPVYIPQMPAECYDMLDAGLTMSQKQKDQHNADERVWNAVKIQPTIEQLNQLRGLVKQSQSKEKPADNATKTFSRQFQDCASQ